MANSAQAIKRARQAVKRRARNQGQRAMMRTYVKRVIKAIESGDREGAAQAYREAVPVIDKVADKDLIHRNKAARHKSRLNARIKAMA